MRTHLGLLAVFLASALPTPAVGLGEEANTSQSAITPAPFTGGHLRRHHESNRRLAQGDVDMLMFGDSITQSWNGRGRDVWNEYYAGRKAVNLGRSGARTQHVLWQVDHLDVENIAPKLAVVLIGTNNTTDNTAEEIAEGVTRIVQRLRTRLPRTKILLLAIFPNGRGDNDPRRQVARRASQLYSKLGEDEMVVYMDLRARFVTPDGAPTTCLRSNDLLHLTVEGYRAWAEAIEPVVAEVVGPKKAQ